MPQFVACSNWLPRAYHRVQLTLRFLSLGVEGPPLRCVLQVGLVLRPDVATSLASQLRRCKAGWQHCQMMDALVSLWGAYLHVC